MRPEIKNYKAEAFNSYPRPNRITWQMQMWCLAVYMLMCSLFVVDLIVGMEELELHFRCRRKCNFQKIKIATISVENGPTCYRAPKWPDPEFPREIPKKYPPARNSGIPEFTPKIPRKYRKNTPGIPKMRIFGIFLVFFGYFLGVPDFRPEGYFFGIFRGSQVGAFLTFPLGWYTFFFLALQQSAEAQWLKGSASPAMGKSNLRTGTCSTAFFFQRLLHLA